MGTNVLISNVVWRAFISLLAIVGLCCLIFVFHSKDLTGPNVTGSHGIKVSKERRFGSNLFVIDSVSQNSALRQAGLKRGDLIEFDNYHHWHGTRYPGERVEITLISSGQARKVAMKSAPALSSSKAGLTILSILAALISSVLGVLIAFKKADVSALRALSLYFVLLQFNLMRFVSLPGAGMELAQYAWAATIWPIWASLTYFAARYQDENPGPFRAMLRRIMRPLIVLTVLATGYAIWAVTHSSPGFDIQTTIFSNVIGAAVLLALWEGWRRAHGEARQRHLWILVLFGMRTVITFPTFFSFLLTPAAFEIAVWLHRSGSLIFCIGFAYSVLRHRILNFQFAVNRTLVFTLTSLLLFLAFWLIEQVVHKLVHFDAAENNSMLSGSIAFGLFFMFNRLHHRVEHWVEHLFFKQWRAREAALRAFLMKAAHFMESGALVSAFGAALDRFNSGGGNAIYLAADSAHFKCAYSSLGNAPRTIAGDDDIAVSLRTNRQAVVIAHNGVQFPAELALPILQNGNLTGFVLLGTKPEAQAYRPDEQEVLEFAARQIGQDLHLLHGTRIAEQLQHAQREMDVQKHEQLRLRQELDSVKQERETLMLALSKVRTSA